MQLKDLCTSCNCWTITLVEHDSTTAEFTCTHCQNKFELPWNSDTRFLIRSIRNSLKKRTKKYPELQELKSAGDFVKLQEKIEPEKGGCR